MSLAIVIPTFQRVDRVRACLASVTRYCPSQTDVVVVDDASPADVANVVAAFPGVRHVRLAKRGGFCVAANAGIAATTAPIVELLNDDTEVCPGWASAALRAFDDPRVAAVAPLVLRPDGRIDSAGDRYDPGGFAQKIGHGESINASMLQRRAVFGASGSSAFYRRSFLERVGLFPESFGAYFEDVDLACRIQRAGGTILFEPESRVIHHGGSSHGPASRRMIEQQSRNEEWLYWRNAPRIVQSLPRHVAVLAAKALRRWTEGRLVPWLCGRARALRELRACRQHARSLAAINPASLRALKRAHPKS
jgi:GT2 family glycosyltransferase